MEQKSSGGLDARTLLAFALMILIWVGFTHFFGPKKSDVEPGAPGPATGETAAPASFTSVIYSMTGTPVVSDSHSASIAASVPSAVNSASASSTHSFSGLPSSISKPNWSGLSLRSAGN